MATKTDTKNNNLPRVFIYNGAELEDFDPALDEKDIKKQYEQVYPELTTASISMEIKDHNGQRTRVYSFKKAAGTKG